MKSKEEDNTLNGVSQNRVFNKKGSIEEYFINCEEDCNIPYICDTKEIIIN